jgi:hypothetical protein
MQVATTFSASQSLSDRQFEIKQRIGEHFGAGVTRAERGLIEQLLVQRVAARTATQRKDLVIIFITSVAA